MLVHYSAVQFDRTCGYAIITHRVCVRQRSVEIPSSTRSAGVAQSAEQLSCKQQVIGSSPIVGSVGYNRNCLVQNADMGGCPSGQRELTVNQPADAYGGSNPPPPTISAHIAQQVEHILGKNEVIGSSPIVGSLNVCVRARSIKVDGRVG